MSIGWLTKVAASDVEIAVYATGADRIGRRDPGEITYLQDVARYEYFDGTAWQPLGGGGGSGIPPSIVTAAGDLIAATGNATVARLGKGASGQVLTVGGADPSGLQWAAPSAGATAPLTLTAPTAATVPLTLAGAASQTADLLDIKNSGGTKVLAVTAAGLVTTAGSELVLEETGDVSYGTARLHVGGLTAKFETLGPVGLAELVLVPSGGFGWTLRAESRSFHSDPANNGFTELQLMAGASGGNTAGWFGPNGSGTMTRFAIGAASGSWGGGAGSMIFLANDTSDPSTNPVGGGILYVSAGALEYRGTGGTVTPVAPA